MKVYQPKRSKYYLPHDVYMQVRYIIRDYDRMQQELHDMIVETKAEEGKSSSPGNPVQTIAIRREELRKRVDAVDKAVDNIRVEYRRGVLESILLNKPYPRDADRSTYVRAKQKFIYDVARYMNII